MTEERIGRWGKSTSRLKPSHLFVGLVVLGLAVGFGAGYGITKGFLTDQPAKQERAASAGGAQIAQQPVD